MQNIIKINFIIFFLFFGANVVAQQHPSLMLTKVNIVAIRKGCDSLPILKTSYLALKADADEALSTTINVPKPVDGGGGYTHEQHKRNYTSLLNCATVYQITSEKKYADYVKTMLLDYAGKYQNWPNHPKSKSLDDAGKIFWQSLNDYVWQIYAIQAYDLVYDTLNKTERDKIENELFIPILKFFTEDRKVVFDKIHNHGTWNLAAVGITGYVLNKPVYVKKAIYGSNLDGKTGYLAQINKLFSPDGYYMEGPYYQRYALLPFILFAKAIQNYQPELNIFKYRDELLAKAIHTSLQTTYTNKVFFPINDAIRDKTFESIELVYGSNLAYADIKPDADLLDIVQQQNKVIISDAGLKVALAIAQNKAVPFNYQTLWIKDGAKGDEGGIGVLRFGQNIDQQCLVLKASSQGMGHGHFDRLNLLFYDNGTEHFYDYGSARFLNIDTKGGGNYLPENQTWAKQTVAHNTLVVDQTSQYQAQLSLAESNHPTLLYFNNTPKLKVVSAKEDHAYENISLIRTSALLKIDETEKPLLIDVFKVIADKPHQYDLPFWYQGKIVNTSEKIIAQRNNLTALGTDFGYQHLWLNADKKLSSASGFISVLNKNRFYTTHFTSNQPLKIKLVSIGANDPDLNLAEGKAFILSQSDFKNQTFISVTDTHGNTNPVKETVTDASSIITDLKLVEDSITQTTISFKAKDKLYIYQINYQNKNNYINIR
ncbi:heparinase [Pedobacter psychrophilus]|uniref:Heparinase n=2 Tax=Pedobacter psychrophilus TaxID=1826909 RepID=A0A179DCB7_9SPHI|nr:heparinase [Pedobacter psychrophilus]